MILRRPALILLLCLALAPEVALARSSDAFDYRAAFAALDSGQYQRVASLASRGPDVVMNDVLRTTLMARPGNDYSFEELSQFVSEHADWPGLRGILMIAEQKIPSGASPQQIINWFKAHPPLTLTGFYRYMDALNDSRQSAEEAKQVKNYWVEHDFQPTELVAFRAHYQPILNDDDDRARLDRLLWDSKDDAVKAMYPFVSAGERALAEARLALNGQAKNAQALLDRVPSALQDDPGLLYEKLRWHRKHDDDDEAISILQNAPDTLGKPEAWWEERNIMIRRAMEKHDYALAYKLAVNHRLTTGLPYLQAEFIAGWLALRSFNNAAQAKEHFQNMLEQASTPISRARGYYWLGRSLEAAGDKNAAEQSYENAATLNLTFYGQLAITKLYANPVLRTPAEPPIPDTVRRSFVKNELVQAVDHLMRLGQLDRARIYQKAAADAATQRAEFVLLMEQAYRLQRPDWAIMTAKAANQKNIVVSAQAYPLLSMRIPTPPDAAFTYALIRQESQFNASARSPAGARGLMQMMPRTAKEVAKQSGIAYKESRLGYPDYNVRLGTAFAQRQIDNFDGSYILALAGYNAGPGRVREWIDTWGDPRSPRFDPIDWIELIPIYETRNYVQRIMENIQIYRARLNKGEAPLQIMKDLRR